MSVTERFSPGNVLVCSINWFPPNWRQVSLIPGFPVFVQLEFEYLIKKICENN